MNLGLVAARNILRNKGRTTLTILGASVAILAFVMLRTIVAAWYIGIEQAVSDRLGTRHKVSFILPLPLKYMDTVRATPGVKAATWLNWFGAKDPKDPNNIFGSMAVDAESFLSVYDEMVITPEEKTRWLENRQGAIIGDVLARKMNLKVGDKLTLSGTIYPGDWQFEVSGIYMPARRTVDRSTVVFHWKYLNEGIPDRMRDSVGWIATRIDSATRGPEISAAIDKVFDEKDVQTTTMTERAMGMSFMGMFSAILSALDIVTVIILAIMMMILGNTIAMGVRERTREYGVLRALGFSPGHIAMFVMGEALVIGVLTGAVGIALSYPVIELGLGRWLEENVGSFFPYFRIPVPTMVAGMGLAIALALVAALLPAYRASKLSVTDALRRVA
jgi:putative ABC transport system permease protein